MIIVIRYTMGSAEPRSFSRGKRGIAGTLVFVLFDHDRNLREIEQLVYGLIENVIASGLTHRDCLCDLLHIESVQISQFKNPPCDFALWYKVDDIHYLNDGLVDFLPLREYPLFYF